MPVPRKKRARYLQAASQIAARLRIEVDLNDWSQIWALLDEHGIPFNGKPMFLYAIADLSGGVVKIGKSRRIMSRLRQFKTGNPAKLKLWAYCPHEPPFTEMEAHTALEAHRVSGEWFRLNEETRRYIDAMRNYAGFR